MFTDFELLDWKSIERDTPWVRYVAWGEETCPRTQRRHFQGFLGTTTMKSLRQMKKLSKTVHFERMYGTLKQNEDYCSKEGQLEVVGHLPVTRGKRTDLQQMMDDVKEGMKMKDLLETHKAAWRYQGALKTYIEQVTQERGTKGVWEEMRVFVYAGPTGAGKTRRARQFSDSVYVLHASDLRGGHAWWDGYQGESTLVIDEYANQLTIDRLLKLTDIYPIRLQVKGSHTYREWDTVIITTNLTRGQFHAKAMKAHIEAFERRLTKWVQFVDGGDDEEFDDLGDDHPSKVVVAVGQEVVPGVE